MRVENVLTRDHARLAVYSAASFAPVKLLRFNGLGLLETHRTDGLSGTSY